MVSVRLSEDSVRWALQFVAEHSDGDLFPRTPEFRAVAELEDDVVRVLTTPEIQQFVPGACRRFLVPKDQLSFRQATQLDAQDALVLTALVHQYGPQIESRRMSRDRVFSYRFQPDASGLYGDHSDWSGFWKTAQNLCAAGSVQYVVYCDIADFYNQIAHHLLENELISLGLPNQAAKWVIRLAASTTASVSRGLPVGPHAVHLLAEATLIPVDNALEAHGVNFVRFVDDYLLLCASEDEARRALATFARTLEAQQHMHPQRAKTAIYSRENFIDFAEEMVVDRPISGGEADLLEIVRKYSRGNPYATVWFSQISEADWKSITPDTLAGIIQAYLSSTEVDYVRLGWFYRRLAQIGHPGALAATVANMAKLTPCLPSVVSYIGSLQNIDSDLWRMVGTDLVGLLDREMFQEEYFQILLLGLFARNQALNHFQTIVARYSSATPSARRQIILAARENNAVAWLRELKMQYSSMDPGQKLAFVYAFSIFEIDEKKHFINNHALEDRPLFEILKKWAKQR